MTRKDQYIEYLHDLALLMFYAAKKGIIIRQGEAHRPKMVAEDYAKRGVGIVNSMHRYSLAQDLWIVSGNGKGISWDQARKNSQGHLVPVPFVELTLHQKKVRLQYEDLGRFWEALGNVWGGKFRTRYDPCHFQFGEDPA